MTDVVFCYPSRLIGGVEFLFVKCAKYLATKESYHVHYIDFSDGFGYGLLKDNKSIEHIEYYSGHSVILPEGAIVVTPLNYLPLFESVIGNASKCKFIFWSLSPFNVIYYINLYKHKLFTIGLRKRKEIGTYLKKLSEKGIVRYMEYNNYFFSSTVFSYKCENLSFLPIFIDDFEKCQIKPYNFVDKEISFIWLGRIDIDKYNTIATYINELEGLISDYKVTLYIVGDGKKKEYLKKQYKETPVHIIYKGKMVGEELKDLIYNKIDIGLAHGTSALDIAKMGKPVIVEGALEKPFKAGIIKDYVLLSETENYDVTSPGYYKSEEIHYFKDLVYFIINNYEDCARNNQDHVYNNHTVSNVGRIFEQSLSIAKDNTNNVTYHDLHDVAKLIRKNGVDFNFHWKIVRRILSYF